MKYEINFTEKELYALANFIEENLISTIRNDKDLDNFDYIRSLMSSYEKIDICLK